MALEEELSTVSKAASAFRGEGEELIGVIAGEATGGHRIYVCAFERDGRHAWVALDGDGRPLSDRIVVRDAVSMIGLCELAEESAGGGDIRELRKRLAALRASESPEGIDAAERAAANLERTLVADPRVASASYLDAVGTAAAALEHALGSLGVSPFAEAMREGMPAVEALVGDVEANYKLPLG